MSKIINFFMTGFPSPWRWARRKYWLWVFEQLTGTQKYLAEMLGVNPQSLIDKGKM
jgi:hypothetical protein